MAEHTVHIRLDSTYYDTLQRMRERERFPPSINAIATALLKSGIDAAAVTPAVQAVIGTASPVRVLTREEAGLSPDIPPLLRPLPPPTETAPERYHRLLAASGLTEKALVRQLRLSSRGKLQHALRRGEVPPEVEAWMRQREEGGR